DTFLKTLRKFVDINYTVKGESDLIIIVHYGDLKFLEENAKAELPCIKLTNGILFDKVILTKYLFGIINCKHQEKFKMLIFAPTFYHLYLLSSEELKMRGWKSIWVWNKKRLIFAEDLISVK
ncbi:MAG: hypothetical protein ACK4NF_03190, partial [Planctomycetota bacterium]